MSNNNEIVQVASSFDQAEPMARVAEVEGKQVHQHFHQNSAAEVKRLELESTRFIFEVDQSEEASDILGKVKKACREVAKSDLAYPDQSGGQFKYHSPQRAAELVDMVEDLVNKDSSDQPYVSLDAGSETDRTGNMHAFVLVTCGGRLLLKKEQGCMAVDQVVHRSTKGAPRLHEIAGMETLMLRRALLRFIGVLGLQKPIQSEVQAILKLAEATKEQLVSFLRNKGYDEPKAANDWNPGSNSFDELELETLQQLAQAAGLK